MALTKVTSALTNLDGGITIDNITIDGTEIDLSSGDLTIDVAGDIILDADGADIKLYNGGTHWGSLYTNATPANLYLQNMVSDGDIYLSGSDGGSNINALVLDMSDAGTAQFNKEIDLLQSNHLRWKHAAGGTIRASIDADSNDNLMFYTGSSESERMRIDSAGKVGIGGTPSVAHVDIKSTNSDKFLHLDDGTNVALTFQKNGTTSFIIQTQGTGFSSWKPLDLRANYFEFKPNNSIALSLTGTTADFTHTQSAHTNGIKIINSQAGGYGSALTFQSERSDNNVITDAARIRSEGANSWNSDSTTESALVFEVSDNNSLSEAMRIRNDGTLVIATTSNQGVGGLTFGTSSNGINVTNNTTTGAGNGHEFYVFRRNSTQIGSIVMSNTDGVTYSTSSDARLKNVLGKAKGLEIVNKLNPVNFEWKESKKIQDGLIAQEVEELIPHAVAVSEEGHYSMDYSQVVTPLIKAIQEQQKEIEELKQNSHAPKTIEEMEGYEDLINRIKELENK